ncbi:MAG: ATP-binding cassette domain-containing protein [Pseudomonadota bacterium]
MIVCDDIRFAYGETVVLRGVSLTVDDSACTLLRGRSGGGKTTLLRILSRLMPADSGRLRIDSHNVDFSDGTAGRPISFHAAPLSTLSMLHQQNNLWPNLTVSENIALVTDGDKTCTLGKEAISLLEMLDVGSLTDRFPTQCSVGQRQRIAVARIILSPAKHVLMDEPTSALDGANRKKVRDLVHQEIKKGRSFLIISHDDRDFAGAYNRLYELENGLATELTSQIPT